MPQVCPREKAAALSILGLGAGASTWVGPAIVTWFEGWRGVEGVIWIFSGLYVVSALLTVLITVSPEARAQIRRDEQRDSQMNREAAMHAVGNQ